MFNRVSPESEPAPLHNERRIALAPSPEAVQAAQWSPLVQTTLDQPPSVLPIRLALSGLLFTAGFATWAWLGRVNETAHAQGKLIPTGEVYKVNPTDTGKVSRVLVREGQQIQAGQPLLELDPELNMTEIEGLEKQLAADQTQLSQTQTLMAQLVMQAQTRAAIGQAATDAQKAAATQAESNIGTTQALLDQLEADAAAQQQRLDKLMPLLAEGAIAQENIFQVEQSLRERQRSITERQGSLTQSQSDYERLQAELAQKKAEERQYQLESQQQIEQLKLQILELRAKIGQTQTQLKAARAKRKQRIVYAPTSGQISTLSIRNPGEVVQPGQPFAEIAPAHKGLVLSALLPNREAGFVKLGMPVQVKLDAYPFENYGIVKGKVTAISPDAQPNEQLGQVYRVEVQLDHNYVTHEHQKVPFKAGQTATAEIVTRQRRIIDVLFDPLKQLQGDMNL